MANHFVNWLMSYAHGLLAPSIEPVNPNGISLCNSMLCRAYCGDCLVFLPACPSVQSHYESTLGSSRRALLVVFQITYSCSMTVPNLFNLHAVRQLESNSVLGGS